MSDVEKVRGSDVEACSAVPQVSQSVSGERSDLDSVANMDVEEVTGTDNEDPPPSTAASAPSGTQPAAGSASSSSSTGSGGGGGGGGSSKRKKTVRVIS